MAGPACIPFLSNPSPTATVNHLLNCKPHATRASAAGGRAGAPSRRGGASPRRSVETEQRRRNFRVLAPLRYAAPLFAEVPPAAAAQCDGVRGCGGGTASLTKAQPLRPIAACVTRGWQPVQVHSFASRPMRSHQDVLSTPVPLHAAWISRYLLTRWRLFARTAAGVCQSCLGLP